MPAIENGEILIDALPLADFIGRAGGRAGRVVTIGRAVGGEDIAVRVIKAGEQNGGVGPQHAEGFTPGLAVAGLQSEF